MSTLDATSLTTTKMLLAKTSTMEMMLRALTALRPRKMSVVASLGEMGWMMRNHETHIRGEEALHCTQEYEGTAKLYSRYRDQRVTRARRIG